MPPVHNPLGANGGVPPNFAMPPRDHYDGARMKPSSPTPSSSAGGGDGGGIHLSMGEGNFTAMLITLTMTTVGVLIWVAYRYMKNRQLQQLKVGKSVTKKSIAQQVLNAMVRAKGVAVWLKAIRYVHNGLTDDRMFKNNSAALANARNQHNNPFLQDDHDDTDAGADGSYGASTNRGAGKETNLAIIICVDEPKPSGDTSASSAPSAHSDAERLTQMFDQLAYFGGSYKTVTFSTKSVEPTSVNLGEILIQLAAARRQWNHIVVYISASTRAFPKDFLDASVFRNPNSDLSAVERFSRPVKQQQKSGGGDDADDGGVDVASLPPQRPFAGSAGLEFLAQPDNSQDPLAWVDVALFLDRLRHVTKRRDDDTPILLLLDPIMAAPLPAKDGARRDNGVSSAVAWMHVEAFPVAFDEHPVDKEQQQRGKSDEEKLVVTGEEMKKFLPDAQLLQELDEMPVDVLLRNALGLCEQLTATVVCATNQPPRAASAPKSAAAAGRKRAATVASAFCEAILDAQRGGHSGAGGGWSSVPTMGGGGVDGFDALLTSAPLGGAGSNIVPETILRTSSMSLEDTVVTSLYDAGIMTSETLALHLAHYHNYRNTNSGGASLIPPKVFVVHSCGKGAMVPPTLQPVPLATRVAMMPRPLHCRAPHKMSQFGHFLFSQVEAEVRRLWCSNTEDDHSKSKLVTLLDRNATSSSSPCGSTILAKRLAWDPQLLQKYTSGVVYVDLRDFKTTSLDSLVVDLIGYMCRLVGIAVQLATVDEARGVWERVWCHSEAIYFVILDHAPAEVASSLAAFLSKATSEELTVVKTRVLLVPSISSNASSLTPMSAELVSRLSMPQLPNQSGKEENRQLQQMWASQLVESLMGRSGAHLTSTTWSTLRPLVSELVSATIFSPVKPSSTLDILPILEYFVKRAAATHHTVSLRKDQGDGASIDVDASPMWTMLGEMSEVEVIANIETLLFNGSTRLPILIAPNAVDASASRKVQSGGQQQQQQTLPLDEADTVVYDRLMVLQSILVAPSTFPSQDSANRIALHRARLIAVMFGRLTTHRFTLALQELVTLGVVIAEHSSFASDAMSQATLLEDAHAAIVDAAVMLRLNHVLGTANSSNSATWSVLRHVDLTKLLDGGVKAFSSFASIHSVTEFAKALGSDALLDEHQLVGAVRLSLISSMLPFVHPTRRSETRNQGVYLELVSLIANLHGSVASLKDVPAELVSNMCDVISYKMCSPWFLHSILDQCSVARLIALFQRVRDVLTGLNVIWSHNASRAAVTAELTVSLDVAIVKRALTTLCTVLDVLEAHKMVLHRNPLEVWSALYLHGNVPNSDDEQVLPCFKLERQLQSISDASTQARELPPGIEPVLAVEPSHNATVAMDDAFDGSMLFAASSVTLSNWQCGSISKHITAGLFVAKGALVVGFSDGSFAVVRQQQQQQQRDRTSSEEATTSDAAVAESNGTLWAITREVSSESSGHLGAAISEFMVVRGNTTITGTSATPSMVALVTCSKANRTMRRWSTLLFAENVEDGAGASDVGDDVVGLLPPPSGTTSSSTPEQQHQQLRQRRVMFPETGDYGVSAQHELTTLHHFYAKVVRCATNPTTVGEAHFGRDRRPALPHGTLSTAGMDVLMLQYGLPDLYRGGQYNENTGDSELNSVAIAHDEGLSLCSGSVTLPVELQGNTKGDCSIVQCGMDRRGHLITAVALGGRLSIIRFLKEVGGE